VAEALPGQAPREARGRLLLCFDFEGSYGMPHAVPYDLAAGTSTILKILAAHDARAVFFVVGRLALEHPQILRSLGDAGHEIGLHGYEHDDLAAYDAARLAELDSALGRVAELVERLTGRRPAGFRAPYLLGPHFYRDDVYAVLRAQGYRWVSNREVRYPVELLRPDRGVVAGLAPSAWRGRRGDRLPRLRRSRLALTALNAGLVARETFGGSPAGRLRWLLGGRPPFLRDGLVEVPLYGPLDCDLLGLPTPTQNTPPNLLAYAGAAMRACAVDPGMLRMVTFHDWILAGGNRNGLLADTLAAARDADVEVSTIAENPDWLLPAG
jgi:Polysaccharide deacetylase